MYNSGRPTHQNGRELDYVVSSANIPDHPVRRLNSASADHYAVAVGGMRAAGEPHSLFTEPRHIENMQNGGSLEALAGGSFGLPAVTDERDERSGQRWDLEFDGTGTVRIRNPKGLCLDGLLDGKDHGRPVMLNCGLSGVERWQLLSFGNEQYRIRSIAAGLCLDVGTSTTPRDVTHLALTPCNATDSQHWLLTPPAGADSRNKALASDLSVSHTDPVGLEHVQTGRMPAGEPRGLDGMRVRAYPHRTQPTPNREKWIPEWVDNVRVRMRDAATGLCIQTDANLPNDGFLGIDLRACNSSCTQTWRVQPVSENAFRLRNDQPVLGDDACLDMDRLAASTGVYIVNTTQCGGGDSDSQHWSFVPFDTSTGPDETGE
ncbi:hypothetical protein CTZ27_11910 [Streptomyces griseocarneus]|nr:hypothetical protein CTZ27_11910 [Streptomyces griseocarneus]